MEIPFRFYVSIIKILLGKRLVYCTYNNEEMRINCSAHLNFQ